MSSNIPKAREILEEALENAYLRSDLQKAIRKALALMTRSSPPFRAPRRYRRLSPAQTVKAKALRDKGMGMNDIAVMFNTGIGRVSEAINRSR